MQHVFFEAVRSQLDGAEVHPRQGPILGLLLHKDGISQADLVREMHVSAATVAVSLSRLEKLGYVTRARNERNQRANVLALTEQGRREAMRMEKLMLDIGRAALEGFSESDKAAAASLFGQMVENIRRKYGIKEWEKEHAPNE
ncbi:MAG: MarR family winged helix-turn-helix transcriptional regulator [Candidatus Limiplasma sp.]|nr:MarR family winged helix-turn-helix transcriptional regulator [Candidatus Limiplasma sp.]